MKKKFKKLSQEEIKELNLHNRLKDLRERFLPKNPTYFFEVGEEVELGLIKKSVVAEKLDDGLIYKVHCIKTEHNYGHPFDYEEDMYVSWTSIRKKLNYDNVQILTNDDTIFFNVGQRDIMSIMYMKYYFGVNEDTDYQRGLCWTLEDKVKLIDSIFKNIEIGKFALIQLPLDEEWERTRIQYEILDGKQRMNALTEFYEDRFQYQGKFFSQLHGRDKSQFEGYPITVAITEKITQEQKYQYFLKLNTTGKPMPESQITKVKNLLNEC